MGFINVKLGDAKEQEPVPEDRYDLRIVKAEDGKSKKGNDMTTVSIKIEDSRFPNAELIGHWLVYPSDDTKPETAALFLRNIARFLSVFGIPFEDSGFNSDDLNGATGNCLVTQEEDDEGVIRNRLVLPRLDT